jgi:hypothetical protein
VNDGDRKSRFIVQLIVAGSSTLSFVVSVHQSRRGDSRERIVRITARFAIASGADCHFATSEMADYLQLRGSFEVAGASARDRSLFPDCAPKSLLFFQICFDFGRRPLKSVASYTRDGGCALNADITRQAVPTRLYPMLCRQLLCLAGMPIFDSMKPVKYVFTSYICIR